MLELLVIILIKCGLKEFQIEFKLDYYVSMFYNYSVLEKEGF